MVFPYLFRYFELLVVAVYCLFPMLLLLYCTKGKLLVTLVIFLSFPSTLLGKYQHFPLVERDQSFSHQRCFFQPKTSTNELFELCKQSTPETIC